MYEQDLLRNTGKFILEMKRCNFAGKIAILMEIMQFLCTVYNNG